MACTAITLQAQSQAIPMSFPNEGKMALLITQMINHDLEAKQQPRQVLSSSRYLLHPEEDQLWTNGLCLYETHHDPEQHEINFSIIMKSGDIKDIIEIEPLKVKGKSITSSSDPSVKISIERLGGHIMLVGRNASGIPVMALQQVTQQQVDNDSWMVLLLETIMGSYSINGKENLATFGPRMPFYQGNKYDTDPGIFNGIHVNNEDKSIDILYGNNRVSRGDPNSPKWGKMPGGGGAGAVMGPMMWTLTHTVDGLKVNIVDDEPFVPHNPAIGKEGETAMLTKLQCPFEGMDGKWAFASAVPLTEALLQLFPTEVLTLMRGEIYARHGDTFKNASTQRYFDAQPWYKPSKGKAIRLTDLERFNYQLIKAVEQSR